VTTLPTHWCGCQFENGFGFTNQSIITYSHPYSPIMILFIIKKR
jgi:hypothetical protein